MRAYFLGQNVCALGFGVAMVRTPPLEQPLERLADQSLEAGGASTPKQGESPMRGPRARELRRLIPF